MTVTVEQVTTTTSLSATPGFLFVPSILLVNVGPGQRTLPSGKVQIKEGATVIRTLDVVLGVAIGTVPSSATGLHTYTATFVPNDTANVKPSTSAPVTVRTR